MKSMTGYGLELLNLEGDILRVEVSSSNHRFLKLVLRLPEQFQPYEREIEKMVRDTLGRGSVSVTAIYQPARPVTEYVVDAEVIQRYSGQLKKLNKQLHLDEDVTLGLLLSLPGSINTRDGGPASARKWKALRGTFKVAIEKLAQMRETEGASLQRDLLTRVRRLTLALDRVEKQVPRIALAYAARLKRRIKEMLRGTDVKLTEQDVVKEVALFAERSDVAEEICRLRSHLEQLTVELGRDGEVGRKLDFIAQEMLREVNTIGAKASDAQVARVVVSMKSEIDKIKEQVQNIE